MIIAAFMVQTIKVIRTETMHEDSNTHVNIVRLVNHGENNMTFSIPACNVYELKIYICHGKGCHHVAVNLKHLRLSLLCALILHNYYRCKLRTTYILQQQKASTTNNVDYYYIFCVECKRVLWRYFAYEPDGIGLKCLRNLSLTIYINGVIQMKIKLHNYTNVCDAATRSEIQSTASIHFNLNVFISISVMLCCV